MYYVQLMCSYVTSFSGSIWKLCQELRAWIAWHIHHRLILYLYSSYNLFTDRMILLSHYSAHEEELNKSKIGQIYIFVSMHLTMMYNQVYGFMHYPTVLQIGKNRWFGLFCMNVSSYSVCQKVTLVSRSTLFTLVPRASCWQQTIKISVFTINVPDRFVRWDTFLSNSF